MKELSIEEKAKRYDEAIKKAKYYYDEDKTIEFANYIASDIFPELKDSEDERIRNFLIDFIKVCGWTEKKDQGWPLREECVAWLEKQGERMSDPRYSILDKLIEADGIYQMAMNDAMVQEAKTKAIDALSKLEIGKLLEIEKQGEQKSAWSEEDDIKALNRISTILVDASEVKNWWKEYRLIERDEMIRLTDFLKSLKDRVQPQPKQEWSEKDYNMLGELLNYCELSIAYNGKGTLQANVWEQRKDWLKSLKPQKQWKPSDEQMLAINTAINVLGKGTINGKYLIELQEQLKKLKS